MNKKKKEGEKIKIKSRRNGAKELHKEYSNSNPHSKSCAGSINNFGARQVILYRLHKPHSLIDDFTTNPFYAQQKKAEGYIVHAFRVIK